MLPFAFIFKFLYYLPVLDRIWEKVQKSLTVFEGEDNLPCRDTTLVLFGSCSIAGGLELLPNPRGLTSI